MLDLSKKFHLFACCYPVKGAARSIIYDVQRESFDFITNDLFDILQLSGKASISDIIDEYGQENAPIVNEYFEFLYSKDYIFFSELEPDVFPPINEEFEKPCVISNTSVELSTIDAFKMAMVALDNNGCEALSIVAGNTSFELLSNALDIVSRTHIRFVNILADYADGTLGELESLLGVYHNLSNIYLFNAPRNEELNSKYEYATAFLIENSFENSGCGYIKPKYFSVNMDFFFESRSCNNCLNRKIHIDSLGNLKSCPFSNTIHGCISETPLDQVVSLPSYKKLASITKDEVETCKDCEFRYMCSDCRVFLKDKNNPLSKPLHCNYDPYTGKWGK